MFKYKMENATILKENIQEDFNVARHKSFILHITSSK